MTGPLFQMSAPVIQIASKESRTFVVLRHRNQAKAPGTLIGEPRFAGRDPTSAWSGLAVSGFFVKLRGRAAQAQR
jgi:hypothetical protein